MCLILPLYRPPNSERNLLQMIIDFQFPRANWMITLKTENSAGVLDVLGIAATYAAWTRHAWRSRYWMTKYKDNGTANAQGNAKITRTSRRFFMKNTRRKRARIVMTLDKDFIDLPPEASTIQRTLIRSPLVEADIEGEMGSLS
ncbi:hypothetical protein GB937_004318 [Aspergillus fischeri]|nr:hypothetical protein GB937_004318 [Aspergillus fischeri]